MGLFRRMVPDGLAFLYEGPDALLPVPQGQVVHHDLGGGGVGRVSTLRHLPGGQGEGGCHENVEKNWSTPKIWHCTT